MITYESQYYGTAGLGDSLEHYGVLGMKWGQRRYQHPDGSYTALGERHRAQGGDGKYHYKSWGTKHNEKKAAKLQKKIDHETDSAKRKALTEKKKKIERRAELSRKLDKREQAYAERVSVAGNLVARTFTTVGSKPYQQIIAMMNENRKGITAKKYGAAMLAKVGGRPLSTVMKAVYIRQDELFNKKTIKNIGKLNRALDLKK